MGEQRLQRGHRLIITITVVEAARAACERIDEVLVSTSPNQLACKQLVGIIMDYMIMHWDDIEQAEAMISKDYDLSDDLPNDVGSAMELLRYEKIGKWEAKYWFWG